jgi:hypothetical protein
MGIPFRYTNLVLGYANRYYYKICLMCKTAFLDLSGGRFCNPGAYKVNLAVGFEKDEA